MTMAPLIVLLLTYALARLALRRLPDRTLPGRLALAVMLLVTGVAHFTRTDALAAMVPPALPAPVLLVYATGIAELVFALLLLARPTAALGWTLVLFFLALLPANVYSAVAQGGLGGHGPAYLWFRVPLQLLFVAWAAHCTGAVRYGSLARRARLGRAMPLGKA
jgi:uncharacterized membrane protein